MPKMHTGLPCLDASQTWCLCEMLCNAKKHCGVIKEAGIEREFKEGEAAVSKREWRNWWRWQIAKGATGCVGWMGGEPEWLGGSVCVAGKP